MAGQFHDVYTTNKEKFSALESAEMARLIYKRFGYNKDQATRAWQRLLQNDCPVSDFIALTQYYGEGNQPAFNAEL